MLKAIYIPDIATDFVPVFIYNNKSGMFESEDFRCKNFKYSFHIVMNDNEWLVFATNNETVYPIENKTRATKDEISSLLDLNK